MEKNLLFSFDDEIATRFYYDITSHKIAVYFAAYYNNGRFVEKECRLVIEKWEYAKSKLSVDSRYKNLEDHVGIISMILDMYVADKKLFLTVNTLDGQYVDLLFYNCNVKVEEIP